MVMESNSGRLMKRNDTFRISWKDIIQGVVVAVTTVLVTKTCDKIVPGENKVIISDTLRVVEAHSPRYSDDSLLYIAISELNKTIRETTSKNNNISIVWPDNRVPSGFNRQSSSLEEDPVLTNANDDSSAKIEDQNINVLNRALINKVVDKKGFYKKGYTISNGGAFYVLQKIPKVGDPYLTIEMDLLQPFELISHIYVTICSINEKGELSQFFSQAYEVRDEINRIMIANNLRKGKNRIDVGVFMKSDEGKDYPTFYRNVIMLEK